MSGLQRARKGDVCAWEIERYWTTADHKSHVSAEWRVGIVAHATRGGIVRTVVPLGYSSPVEIHSRRGDALVKAQGIGTILVAPAAMVDLERLHADDDMTRPFTSQIGVMAAVAEFRREVPK